MAEVLNPKAELLPTFLQRAASVPFEFGQWDCAMTLANWGWLVLGYDPAPDLRGSYKNERGWVRICKQAGGLDRIVNGIALAAAWVPIEEPLLGDIAIVETPDTPTGAIWSGRYWVAKSPNGLSAGMARTLGMWGQR